MQAPEEHLVHKKGFYLFLYKTGDFPGPKLGGITLSGKPGVTFVGNRQQHLFPDQLRGKFGDLFFDYFQNNLIVQGIEVDDGVQAVSEFRRKVRSSAL